MEEPSSPCEPFEIALEQQASGVCLSPAEEAGLGVHLESCERCRKTRAMIDALRISLPSPRPSPLDGIARVRARERRWLVLSAGGQVVAAAAAFAAFGLMWGLIHVALVVASQAVGWALWRRRSLRLARLGDGDELFSALEDRVAREIKLRGWLSGLTCVCAVGLGLQSIVAHGLAQGIYFCVFGTVGLVVFFRARRDLPRLQRELEGLRAR